MFWLNLLAIKADLNNGSAYSFPTPEKWREGSSLSSHYGQVSILLGSDNPLAFPKEEERDGGGAVLWRSVLTTQALIHGAIDPEIITWTDPEPRRNINTVCIQSVSMQNIQEQLLLTVSAENFSDPTNCDKLNLLTKERGIQEIMKNTQVDKECNARMQRTSVFTRLLGGLVRFCQLLKYSFYFTT